MLAVFVAGAIFGLLIGSVGATFCVFADDRAAAIRKV